MTLPELVCRAFDFFGSGGRMFPLFALTLAFRFKRVTPYATKSRFPPHDNVIDDSKTTPSIELFGEGVGTNGPERCHLHVDHVLTDQSSRRPPHHKKCTRTANCFIGRHSGTGSSISRGPCVFSNHTKRPAEGHLGSLRPSRVLPLTLTHRRLRLE
ncbi:uncharacterized protein TNCV_4421701 [Trichonephila clavipes]|nr:uncharacterized protein TNCV_4421701 [Trichonephila clavipes]